MLKLVEVDATIKEIRNLTEKELLSEFENQDFKNWVSDLILRFLNLIRIIKWDSPYSSIHFHRLENFPVISSRYLSPTRWIFT